MEKNLPSPKATFLNLPPEKRRSIVQAAVAEFAGQGYQRASVNNIARGLGIAKGSIYQYFDNKEALFLYVFDQFTAKVKQHVRESVAEQGEQDFFAVTRQVLLAAINFIDTSPEYFHLYLKVLFEQNAPQRQELVARVRLFSLEFFGPLCERARQQGLLRQDVSCRQVVFLMDATMERFLQGYVLPYLDGGLGLGAMSAQRLQEEIDTMILVLRNGLQPADHSLNSCQVLA